MPTSAKRYATGKLWLSAFTAVVSLAAGLAGVYHITSDSFGLHSSAKTEVARLAIRVADAETGAPVRGASIEVDGGHGREQGVTDFNGNAFLSVPIGKYGDTVNVRAHAEGFEPANTFVIPSKIPFDMLLVSQKKAAPSLRSAYTDVVRSGPKASGVRGDFSGWYELAATPPKPGFVIDRNQSSFELVGDRACNSWSECIRVESTETSLVWRFRMLGHSESLLNSGISYSEGILKVTYVPAEHP